MLARLKEDIEVVFDRDPAAKSVVEVLLNYPGLHAIWFHRLSMKSQRSVKNGGSRWQHFMGMIFIC